MKLENVHYSPRLLSKQRVSALFLLSVAAPYVWKRVFRYLSSARWAARATGPDEDTEEDQAARSRVLSGMKRVETFVLACQLANLLAFLRRGTYRTLPERLLGLKMVRCMSLSGIAERRSGLTVLRCCRRASRRPRRRA